VGLHGVTDRLLSRGHGIPAGERSSAEYAGQGSAAYTGQEARLAATQVVGTPSPQPDDHVAVHRNQRGPNSPRVARRGGDRQAPTRITTARTSPSHPPAFHRSPSELGRQSKARVVAGAGAICPTSSFRGSARPSSWMAASGTAARTTTRPAVELGLLGADGAAASIRADRRILELPQCRTFAELLIDCEEAQTPWGSAGRDVAGSRLPGQLGFCGSLSREECLCQHQGAGRPADNGSSLGQSGGGPASCSSEPLRRAARSSFRASWT
jgi:hypothetical protein